VGCTRCHSGAVGGGKSPRRMEQGGPEWSSGLALKVRTHSGRQRRAWWNRVGAEPHADAGVDERSLCCVPAVGSCLGLRGVVARGGWSTGQSRLASPELRPPRAGGERVDPPSRLSASARLGPARALARTLVTSALVTHLLI
jgi:hypothetical protein